MGIKEVGIGLIIMMYTIHALLFVVAMNYDPRILSCADTEAFGEQPQNVQDQFLFQAQVGCEVSNLTEKVDSIRTSLNAQENIAIQFIQVVAAILGTVVSVMSIALFFFTIIFTGWNAIFVTLFGAWPELSFVIFFFGTVLAIIQSLALFFVSLDILQAVRP